MNTLKPSKTAAPPAVIKFDRGVVTVRDKGLVPWGGFSVLQNIKKWNPGVSKRLGCDMFVFDYDTYGNINSFYPSVKKSLRSETMKWQFAHDATNYADVNGSLNVGTYHAYMDYFHVDRIFMVFDMRHYDGPYIKEDFGIAVFAATPIDTDVILQSVTMDLDDFNPDYDDTLPLSTFSKMDKVIVEDYKNLNTSSCVMFYLNEDGIDFFNEKIRKREIAVVCMREYATDYLNNDPYGPSYETGFSNSVWSASLGSWDGSVPEWDSASLTAADDVFGQLNSTTGEPNSPSVGDRYIVTETFGSFTVGTIVQWSGSAWVSTTPVNGTIVEDLSANDKYVLIAGGWVNVPDAVTANAHMLELDVTSCGWESSSNFIRLKLSYSCSGCVDSNISVRLYDTAGNVLGSDDSYATGDEITLSINGSGQATDISKLQIINLGDQQFSVSDIQFYCYGSPFTMC